jgi:dGTPase
MSPSPPIPPHSIADREAALLAPYAMHSRDSAGRKHPEPEHPYRGVYQRDRDRILHSSAFRRLSGKTQVFTGEMGDYHRTRLTHTFEVSSIARTISRSLGLNEDLVEALALFHDVGHPPFGHAGEAALDACLAHCGGFSHNRHAITIAEELEQRYEQFPGLNLTREVLDSQATRVDKSAAWTPLLEAQVVDAADSITYAAHDTDDAVKLGLLDLDELTEIPLSARLLRRIDERSPGIPLDLRRKALVHELIDTQVSDLLREALAALVQARFASAAEAYQSGFRIRPSPGIAAEKQELERFLAHHVYRHPRLMVVRGQAQGRLRAMFEFLSADISRLPPKARQRSEQVGKDRAVGEYLAGMTDRFLDLQFNQLNEGVLRGWPEDHSTGYNPPSAEA